MQGVYTECDADSAGQNECNPILSSHAACRVKCTIDYLFRDCPWSCEHSGQKPACHARPVPEVSATRVGRRAIKAEHAKEHQLT
jgi:hypothetical protein